MNLLTKRRFEKNGAGGEDLRDFIIEIFDPLRLAPCKALGVNSLRILPISAPTH
jgi:hypothetical protein